MGVLQASAVGICPECQAAFVPQQNTQLFCCSQHRAAWNNRMTVRGRVATPLMIAARLTRNGTRGGSTSGYRASVDLDTLIRRWRQEDQDARRMATVAYVDRRYALGFDPI
ncbi:hypothetical protein GCM10022253_23790 [Sphingomonas endophytica]